MPIDFTPACRAALRHAVREAQHHRARLVLLHVIEPPSPLSGIEDLPLAKSNEELESECLLWLKGWAGAELALGWPCELQVRFGKVHREILAVAAEQHADVILMAEQPKNWLERLLLGSVSRKVKRRATCCVLTIANTPEQGARSDAPKFTPETAWRSRASGAIKPRQGAAVA